MPHGKMRVSNASKHTLALTEVSDSIQSKQLRELKYKLNANHIMY